MKINLVRNFTSFIQSQDYAEDEKNEILTLFKTPKIRRVFSASVFLLIWSMAGVFLDSVLLGGGILAVLMMGTFMFKLFLPALIYFFGNMIAKFVFLRVYLKNQISYLTAFLATLPYAGPAILFSATLSREALFMDAMKRYFSYRRSRGFFRLYKLSLRGREENGLSSKNQTEIS